MSNNFQCHDLQTVILNFRRCVLVGFFLHLKIGDGKSYHALTVEEHYRTMYFEALDFSLSSIKERFDQPGYRIYKNLEGLLVKVANKEDYSAEFKEVTELYGDDFDQSELATHL